MVITDVAYVVEYFMDTVTMQNLLERVDAVKSVTGYM